jgi:hypothetical protein
MRCNFKVGVTKGRIFDLMQKGLFNHPKADEHTAYVIIILYKLCR